MVSLLSLLEQLGNEPDLLLTLETYLNLGRRRGHTAKRLGIHPNTLDYRLGRVEELLERAWLMPTGSTGWISP